MVRGEREKYEILGIDRGEYFEEESKSYSQLVKEKKKDSMVEEGMKIEFIKIENERIEVINEEWERIEKKLEKE